MLLFDMYKHWFTKPNPVQHPSATAFMLNITTISPAPPPPKKKPKKNTPMDNIYTTGEKGFWIATHVDVINKSTN